MPSTFKEIKQHFDAGAETVTLTRAEWEGLWEITRGYCANGLQVTQAQRETERVKRISRPVWSACKVVAAQIRRAMEGAWRKPPEVSLETLQRWEMRLRHSMDVSWSDLPPGIIRRGWSIGGDSSARSAAESQASPS